MASCLRNESVPPRDASVISVKIGVRARLTTCDVAVHRTICQPAALRRQIICHSPTCWTRYAFVPAPTMS